jgi:hypothetical protein
MEEKQDRRPALLGVGLAYQMDQGRRHRKFSTTTRASGTPASVNIWVTAVTNRAEPLT